MSPPFSQRCRSSLLNPLYLISAHLILLSVETCVELYGQLSDRYSRARLAPPVNCLIGTRGHGWLRVGPRGPLLPNQTLGTAHQRRPDTTRERARTTRSTGDVARDIKCGAFIRGLSSRCRMGLRRVGDSCGERILARRTTACVCGGREARPRNLRVIALLDKLGFL